MSDPEAAVAALIGEVEGSGVGDQTDAVASAGESEQGSADALDAEAISSTATDDTSEEAEPTGKLSLWDSIVGSAVLFLLLSLPFLGVWVRFRKDAGEYIKNRLLFAFGSHSAAGQLKFLKAKHRIWADWKRYLGMTQRSSTTATFVHFVAREYDVHLSAPATDSNLPPDKAEILISNLATNLLRIGKIEVELVRQPDSKPEPVVDATALLKQVARTEAAVARMAQVRHEPPRPAERPAAPIRQNIAAVTPAQPSEPRAPARSSLALKTFKAHVRAPNRTVVETCIQARNPLDARALLEGQYGRGNIVHPPMEVR